MESHPSMLLDLGRIHEAHERMERTYPASAFSAFQDDCHVVQPVLLALDVYKNRSEVKLVGRLTTALQLQCGRCLESYTLAVSESFDLMYLPRNENAGEGEIEIEEEDLETAFYEGDEIDLGQLMREQFYLALPMKPLCSEQCRGLCPVCGANLNQSSCNCETRWVDPRLEALKSLVRPKN
jgi:uncharacterized protein